MMIDSIEQENLYCMDNYIIDLISLYNLNKLPNKIMLSGVKGIGKSLLAYHLANYILSKNEEFAYDIKTFKINNLNKSFKLVKKNSHPNLYYCTTDDDKKVITINQIRNILSFCNKSSFNNSEKIIIIDNVETLNQSSSNALLKILEEPNEKVIFILIKDSSKRIVKTINSRCINFNINLNHNQKKYILRKILNNDFYEKLNSDFKNYYLSPGDFVNLYYLYLDNNLNYKFSIEELLDFIIRNKLYKNNLYIKKHLGLFFELYFSKKFLSFKNNISAFNDYKNFTKELNDIYKYNLDLETIVIQFKNKIFNGQ